MLLGRLCTRVCRHGFLRMISKQVHSKDLPRILTDQLKGFPIEIKSQGAADQAGRGLFAARPLRKGAIIYQEEPFVSALVAYESQDDSSPRCKHCTKPMQEQTLLSAPSCHRCSDLFCSSACQQESQDIGHSLYCGKESTLLSKLKAQHSLQNMQQAGHDTNSESPVHPQLFPMLISKIMGRMLSDLKQNGSFDASWGLLQHLMWANQEPVKAQWQPSYNILAETLFQKNYDQLFTMDWYLRTTGILHLNTFSVPSSTHYHIALYIVASFHNHDCDPNVLTKFSNGNIQLFAARDINPGEELLISYAHDDTLTDSQRNTHLWMNYGFKCTCSKCLAASNDSKNGIEAPSEIPKI
eukprot:TRINITY_DN13003_c0_g1_i2.p1 TRINITY_DN13003_c0_g1~~TRINITY_DN13003_c0_g1_i2.p1  ORF type:complete len:354 (+),score=60.46 TRINITY_DN13003_c0_g1_i2:49-1110(+)